MYYEEIGYLQALRDILDSGERKHNRTGVATLSKFNITLRFKLDKFPLFTSRKIYWKGIYEELIWFLRGSTNSKSLHNAGVKIWDHNSSREYLNANGFTNYNPGELGPIYGWQWRKFGKSYIPESERLPRACMNLLSLIIMYMLVGYIGVIILILMLALCYRDTNSGVDQIKYIIREIVNNPRSRRIVLSAWNPADLHKMALPPCHLMAIFNVTNSRELNCAVVMRSADMVLGVPFNVASYALLTYLIAKETNTTPGEITLTAIDAHIYENHVPGVKTLINTIPGDKPTLLLDECVSIDNPRGDQFVLLNYNPGPKMNFELN